MHAAIHTHTPCHSLHYALEHANICSYIHAGNDLNTEEARFAIMYTELIS